MQHANYFKLNKYLNLFIIYSNNFENILSARLRSTKMLKKKPTKINNFSKCIQIAGSTKLLINYLYTESHNTQLRSNKVTVLDQSSTATPHPVTNLNNLNMISDVSCKELK